jgi:hypothetical protein
MVLSIFTKNKTMVYQLLGGLLGCRPGLASPLKANENFGWKSGGGASESNTARFRSRIDPSESISKWPAM